MLRIRGISPVFMSSTENQIAKILKTAIAGKITGGGVLKQKNHE